MKYLLGGVAALAAVAAIIAFLVFAWLMIPKGHAQPLSGADESPYPHVTSEPDDQKANMGMYDDAKGPPWAGMPQVAMTQLPFGMCAKPGVAVTVDEHGNNVYAEDNEVIWRCLQTHPTGEPANAPLVYCHQQREQPRLPAIAWRCYHDYSIVFDFYEYDYGKSPLILPDEIEYIDTTRFQ